MKLCTTSPVQNIDLDECVGTSLVKINSNFKALNDGICENNNRVDLLSTSYLNLATSATFLSGLNKVIAWGWIKIAPPTIGFTNNITEVTPTSSSSQYTIKFKDNFQNLNYSVFGTAVTFNSAVTGLFVAPSNFTLSSVDINIRATDFQLTNCDYATIVIYN